MTARPKPPVASEDNFMQHVESLRKKFNDTFRENIDKNDVYDKRDLERLFTEDDYVHCFLKHQRGSIEKAAEMIDISLSWRKELGVNDVTESTFPRHLHEIGGVFYHNRDKDGHPILHIRVAKHKKDPTLSRSVRQFLAWQIDQQFFKHPGKRMVVLIDMTDAGLSNVDIDLIKFQVSCFTTYYPALLAYMLIYEMPWVLNAIWNIIKKLLNAEQQKFVLLVKKPQMLQYIDENQLFAHMGGSDNFKYTYIPSEEIASDYESLASSYEQLSNNTGSSLRKRVTFSDFPKSASFDIGAIEDRSTNISRLICLDNNNVYKGTLASISPPDRLTFHVEIGKGDTVSHISISNTSHQRLSYKVKTTSPDVYRVKPHMGFLGVKDQAIITVTLLNGHQCVDGKDKFLVMLISINDDISENNQNMINSLWKTISKDSVQYMEHRIVCETITVAVENASQTKSQENSISSTSDNRSLEAKINILLQQQQEMTKNLSKIIRLLILLIGFMFMFLLIMAFKCF